MKFSRIVVFPVRRYYERQLDGLGFSLVHTRLSSGRSSGFWSCFTLWQYGLWSFQKEGTKLEMFVPKDQHTQRKLLNFENWISMGLTEAASEVFKKSEF